MSEDLYPNWKQQNPFFEKVFFSKAFVRTKSQCLKRSLKLLKPFQAENVLLLKGLRFDQTIVFRKKGAKC